MKQKYISINIFLSRTYKIEINQKKNVEKVGKFLNRHFTKEEIQKGNTLTNFIKSQGNANESTMQ